MLTNPYYKSFERDWRLDFLPYTTDDYRTPTSARYVGNTFSTQPKQRPVGYGNYQGYNPFNQSSQQNYGGYQASELQVQNAHDHEQPEKPKPNYAGAVTGAAALAGNIYGMSQQGLNLNTNIASQQTDQNSAPVYTAGDLRNQAFGARPKGAQTGEILSGAGQGAAIGTSIMPGIGTAVGAVVGGIASAIGGGARKAKQEREKRDALLKVDKAQKDYNAADVSYRDFQNEIYNYYNRDNAEGREYNVYRTRF